MNTPKAIATETAGMGGSRCQYRDTTGAPCRLNTLRHNRAAWGRARYETEEAASGKHGRIEVRDRT